MKIYFLGFVIGLVAACGSDWQPTAKHLEVQNLFKSQEEPTAKDALWTQDGIFKVGVVDDGSNRNGYAEYVCATLSDYGFKGESVWVQVIDIVELSASGKWKKLGEARCE